MTKTNNQFKVSKLGMARRAGIRIGDVITRINNTYAEGLTLLEAQLLILRSKKQVQIFVRGYVNSMIQILWQAVLARHIFVSLEMLI